MHTPEKCAAMRPTDSAIILFASCPSLRQEHFLPIRRKKNLGRRGRRRARRQRQTPEDQIRAARRRRYLHPELTCGELVLLAAQTLARAEPNPQRPLSISRAHQDALGKYENSLRSRWLMATAFCHMQRRPPASKARMRRTIMRRDRTDTLWETPGATLLVAWWTENGLRSLRICREAGSAHELAIGRLAAAGCTSRLLFARFFFELHDSTAILDLPPAFAYTDSRWHHWLQEWWTAYLYTKHASHIRNPFARSLIAVLPSVSVPEADAYMDWSLAVVGEERLPELVPQLAAISEQLPGPFGVAAAIAIGRLRSCVPANNSALVDALVAATPKPYPPSLAAAVRSLHQLAALQASRMLESVRVLGISPTFEAVTSLCEAVKSVGALGTAGDTYWPALARSKWEYLLLRRRGAISKFPFPLLVTCTQQQLERAGGRNALAATRRVAAARLARAETEPEIAFMRAAGSRGGRGGGDLFRSI